MAAFTGSINPSGLPTAAFFQYGLHPKYTGGGPVVYNQSTPAQTVGSDFTTNIVTASVTGLVQRDLSRPAGRDEQRGTTSVPDVVLIH